MVVHLRLHLARAGFETFSNHTVQMGFDKGKGVTHLVASHRPVPLTSPIPRSESRISQRVTNQTIEVSMHYNPKIFSYRDQHRPCFMALKPRAAAVSSLYLHRICCMTEWDESNGDDAPELFPLLSPSWNRGVWSPQYFGRITVHPLTSDGFALGFLPPERFH